MDAQLALHLDAARPALSWDQLDPEERAVGRALQWGRANARQIRELAAAANVSSRRAQAVVHRLVHQHGWPIGTSMTAPAGNYLIDSAAELEETVKLLRTRSLETLGRAAALQRMSLRAYLGQVQTDLLPSS